MPATITIPKKEYQRLKKLAKLAEEDESLLKGMKESLEDLKAGRVHWAR